jgi:hypothetical protein
MDWIARNCDRCKLSPRADTDGPIKPTCQIEQAIGEAFWNDGSVPDEIGTRMGLDAAGPLALTWDCPERITR